MAHDFDDGWTEAPTKSEFRQAAVADGEYKLEVDGAGFFPTKTGEVFKIKFTILSGPTKAGVKFDKTWFLEKKEGTDEEKAAHFRKKRDEIKIDLNTIGFDVNSWAGKVRKMMEIACEVMKGVRVMARVKNNGEFLNVYVNKRADDDGKPLRFTDEHLDVLANHNFGTNPLGEQPQSQPEQKQPEQKPAASGAAPTPW